MAIAVTAIAEMDSEVTTIGLIGVTIASGETVTEDGVGADLVAGLVEVASRPRS